jgi:hypothetical protein
MSEWVVTPATLHNAQSFPSPTAIQEQFLLPSLVASPAKQYRVTFTENRKRVAIGQAPSIQQQPGGRRSARTYGPWINFDPIVRNR